MTHTINAASLNDDQIALHNYFVERKAEGVAFELNHGQGSYSSYAHINPMQELAIQAGYGVHTVKQYERQNDEGLLWDLHKDAYGFKPRHLNISEMTDEELSEEIELCSEIVYVDIMLERIAELEEIAKVKQAMTCAPLTQGLAIPL